MYCKHVVICGIVWLYIFETVSDYVTHLVDSSLLTDKLSRKDFHGKRGDKDVYPNHLSTVDILTGIREGRLLQGTYRASRDNFLEGFVNVDSYEDPVRFDFIF